MRRILLLLFALTLVLTPASAIAAEPRSGDAVVVRADEVIDDDLYAFGGTVNVMGTVRGDVFALGSMVTVSGVVTGSLMAAGGTVTVSGQVGGNVRAAGGSITIDGSVGGDALVATGLLDIGPNGRVGRDVLMGAGTATVVGQVGRNVSAGVGNLTLNGIVGGNVRAEVETLRLGDRAVVNGDLVYTSEQEATIASGAAVRGKVERNVPERRSIDRGPLGVALVFGLILGWLRMLVGLFALGLLFVLALPGFSRRAVDTLAGSPLASVGLGFALVIAVPVISIIVFIAGLIFGGWWLALITLAVFAIALPIGFVVGGLFVGSWTLERLNRPRSHRIWALLLGLVILMLVAVLPILGGLVVGLAVLFGVGALALAAAKARGRAIA
ncbi:MAG: hypothetical protein HY675_15125 [Chloroflexi bacterium]|nr:hypothetical protein [Chloroflexota bacterium]